MNKSRLVRFALALAMVFAIKAVTPNCKKHRWIQGQRGEFRDRWGKNVDKILLEGVSNSSFGTSCMQKAGAIHKQ